MIIYKVFYPPDLVYFDDMHNSALCRAGEGGSFTLVLVLVLFMVKRSWSILHISLDVPGEELFGFLQELPVRVGVK